MVPRKFNIVEFDGFDLAAQYGEALPGIYDKIVEAHWNCVYIMCFGLKFGGFDIAPQYMTPELFSDHIMLNGIISIDQNDVITVPNIGPQPVEPVIVELSTSENGTTYAPEGVDGFNPVIVSVPESSNVAEVYTIPTAGELSEGHVAIYISREESTDQKPVVAEPSGGIAGQNSASAITALNKTGTPDGSYSWTTADRNYNNLWIGADFGSPVVMNFVTVAPRTWSNRRQIYTVIFEASNDLEEWIRLGEGYLRGNDLPLNKWHSVYTNNRQSYRYYRLRTTTDDGGTINGSVTFTLYGLGFGFIQQPPVSEYMAEAFYKKSGAMYTFVRQ